MKTRILRVSGSGAEVISDATPRRGILSVVLGEPLWRSGERRFRRLESATSASDSFRRGKTGQWPVLQPRQRRSKAVPIGFYGLHDLRFEGAQFRFATGDALAQANYP